MLALATADLTEELWQRYFEDLTGERLGLQSITEGVMPQTLQAIFNQLEERIPLTSGHSVVTVDCVPEKGSAFVGPLTKVGHQILSHHVSFHTHRQYFSNITPVLRQLDKLQALVLKFGPTNYSMVPDNFAKDPLMFVAQLEDLYNYMSELLFVFLRYGSSNPDNSEGFVQWYQFYKNMVSLHCWCLHINSVYVQMCRLCMGCFVYGGKN